MWALQTTAGTYVRWYAIGRWSGLRLKTTEDVRLACPQGQTSESLVKVAARINWYLGKNDQVTIVEAVPKSGKVRQRLCRLARVSPADVEWTKAARAADRS
jgi:hypothetical protein